MTMSSQTPTEIAHCRHRRGTAGILGGTLTAFLVLWLLLFSALTSVSAAAGGGSACSGAWHRSSSCANAFVDTSTANEEEGEEGQGEESEGTDNQEGTPFEAEPETEETASGASYSSPAGSQEDGLVALSHLRLTAKARIALEQHLPSASAVGFSFTLSASATVLVTLLKQTSVDGHERWTTLPDSLTLSLTPGHVAGTLKGHNRLSPGHYRLTVKPANGRPREIYLNTRR
jgi:hypothetical protein